MENLEYEVAREYPHIPEGYKLMAKANDRPNVVQKTAYCYKWTGTEVDFNRSKGNIVAYLRSVVENKVREARENGNNTAYFAYVKVTPMTQRNREHNAQWEAEMRMNDLKREVDLIFHRF